jgi:hypothetical protein
MFEILIEEEAHGFLTSLPQKSQKEDSEKPELTFLS